MSSRVSAGVTAAQIVALAASAKRLVHLTTSERRVELIAHAVSVFAPGVEVVVFPAWDCLPYDRASPSREAMGRRMEALRRFSGAGEKPLIVVTTPEALLQRTPPRSALKNPLRLRNGEPLEVDGFLRQVLRLGYLQDDRVDEAGEVAIRGEVIDLFPAGLEEPYRLELSDGRIAAIRAYDAASQRTSADTQDLLVGPASELVGDEVSREPGAEHRLPEAYPKLETLFDFLPKAQLFEDPRADDRVRVFLGQVAEAHLDRQRVDASQPAEAARPTLAPERLYLTAVEWAALAGKRRLEPRSVEGVEAAPSFAAEARPERALADHVSSQIEAGRRVLLTAADPGDLRTLSRLAQRGVGRAPKPAPDWAAVQAAEPGSLLTLPVALDRGFIDPEAKLAVIAAHDLLGSRARVPGAQPSVTAPWQVQGEDLRIGDIVVHADHGVGAVRGLESVETPAGTRETIRVEYAKGAVLLVPVEEAARLWRYGSEHGGVTLDRLNTDAWSKRRAKIQAEIEDTARSLIALAAERDRTSAAKLVPPKPDYERFAARFPYVETPDQAQAIEDVLGDLASGRPMARLVVGDVGFGKTEVALRAAAAAALCGKQVAVVAPTTVLARQHFNTFTRRFAELGVEVAHLSRLAPTEEAKAVKAGLADGSLRLVVGTHALLGESVAFKDLGLIIIDEEQRFGAAHKSKLRDLGEGVHVLTLTATPIPRTLEGALVGLQDLSTILTPPARRRPIRTFSAPFDPAALHTVLMREKRRGGQSFVVVPRIEDIEPTEAQLRLLASDLDIRVAHGKMHVRDVDVAMVDFAEGRGDVLLATSIIESGLDVPRANTMAVLRADRFGLSQLHQLRGRVGRGRVQGVCYLMTDPGAELSEAAAKRLGTLEVFDRLGAGMAISAADLDQRGAGDLLGDEQAGHVKLIGLSLYQQILAAALKEASGEPADEWTTEIQIDAVGLIPPDYVPEPEIRLNLYARAARAGAPGEVDALAEEIADRFGPPPEPVRNLLALTHARTLARALKVVRIVAGPQAVALTFEPGFDPSTAFAAAFADPALHWTGQRLLYRKPSEAPEERAALLQTMLETLA